MESIDIICVGTLKEKPMREICAEYRKRLSRFCKLTVHELNESKLPDKPSEAEIEKALENEATAMLNATPRDCYKIAMCIEGKQQSSEKLAKTLQNGMNMHGKTAIYIGSSYGLSPKIKSACDTLLSMSELTFPHQLARCMLLEQIYRTYKIRNNETYHK